MFRAFIKYFVNIFIFMAALTASSYPAVQWMKGDWPGWVMWLYVFILPAWLSFALVWIDKEDTNNELL